MKNYYLKLKKDDMTIILGNIEDEMVEIQETLEVDNDIEELEYQELYHYFMQFNIYYSLWIKIVPQLKAQIYGRPFIERKERYWNHKYKEWQGYLKQKEMEQ